MTSRLLAFFVVAGASLAFMPVAQAEVGVPSDTGPWDTGDADVNYDGEASPDAPDAGPDASMDTASPAVDTGLDAAHDDAPTDAAADGAPPDGAQNENGASCSFGASDAGALGGTGAALVAFGLIAARRRRPRAKGAAR